MIGVKGYIRKVSLLKNFLFTDTSKNDFTKVLEVIKYFKNVSFEPGYIEQEAFSDGLSNVD